MEDLATLVRVLTKANLKVEKERVLAAWQSEYRIATIEEPTHFGHHLHGS